MKKINLLDCTLRDGGYINNWYFGKKCIKEIALQSSNAGIEFVELGFLRDVIYNENYAIFSSIEQISKLIGDKPTNVSFAVMSEAVNALPTSKIRKRTDNTVDVIRVIVWKRLLDEGFKYCSEIVDKGYDLCVQPNRTDQYSMEEFQKTIERFNSLNPIGFYVVDSFGVMNKDNVLEYAKIADKTLKPNIALGYHGHNNMLQASIAAEAFLGMGFDRNIMIDGSIFGIGRGAGNLNLELFIKFLNENHGKSYDVNKILLIYDKYIKNIYEKTPWGYSMPFYLTALYRCNPQYAEYYSTELGMSSMEISTLLPLLDEIESVIFSKDTAIKYYENRKREKQNGENI